MVRRNVPSAARLICAACMLALALVFTPRPAISAELVMVEESFCEWCELWNEEIGVVYAKTEEGERAPLRRVEMRSAEMKAMTFKMRVQYTPTFILMEDGAEVGRIEGYPGEDFFWGMLQGLLKKLPATDAATQ